MLILGLLIKTTVQKACPWSLLSQRVCALTLMCTSLTLLDMTCAHEVKCSVLKNIFSIDVSISFLDKWLNWILILSPHFLFCLLNCVLFVVWSCAQLNVHVVPQFKKMWKQFYGYPWRIHFLPNHYRRTVFIWDFFSIFSSSKAFPISEHVWFI